jgi:hypothetical protein
VVFHLVSLQIELVDQFSCRSDMAEASGRGHQRQLITQAALERLAVNLHPPTFAIWRVSKRAVCVSGIMFSALGFLEKCSEALKWLVDRKEAFE